MGIRIAWLYCLCWLAVPGLQAQPDSQIVVTRLRAMPQGWMVEPIPGFQLQRGQLFLVRNQWRQSGDRSREVGSGRVVRTGDSLATVQVRPLPGELVRDGDLAFFMLPLPKPVNDTLQKLARFGIEFLTLTDSLLNPRGEWLQAGNLYRYSQVVWHMMGDIVHAGEMMQHSRVASDASGADSASARYRRVFRQMAEATPADVLVFLNTLYEQPGRYSGRRWRISEVYAAWLLESGAPAH